jgi:hypothetical protein
MYGKDRPLSQCPHCKDAGKKSAVNKEVSASAFHLKGSGWYKTDYSSCSSSGTKKNQRVHQPVIVPQVVVHPVVPMSQRRSQLVRPTAQGAAAIS